LKPHMRVMGRICLHVVSRKLSDTPVSSGFLLVYTTYLANAQIKKPVCKDGQTSQGILQLQHITSYCLRKCSLPTT
jgi:hypothetical protein